MTVTEFWQQVDEIRHRHMIGELTDGHITDDGEQENVSDFLTDMDALASAWYNRDEVRCGAYAEHWKELGKPEGWKGCSLAKGHEGYHRDEDSEEMLTSRGR